MTGIKDDPEDMYSSEEEGRAQEQAHDGSQRV